MAALCVSTVSGDSDVVGYYYCTICEERALKIDADYYCKTCHKYFCRTCVHSHSEHSRRFKKQSPYGKDNIMKWPLSKKMENCLITCEGHKNEKITMYCVDHSKLCCSKCVELNHRECCSVTQLHKAANKRSTKFKSLSVSTQITLSQMKSFRAYLEDSMKSLKVLYKKHEEDNVDRMRLNIRSFLFECENSTYFNVRNTAKEMGGNITSLLADFEKSTFKQKLEELTLKLDPLISMRNRLFRLNDELLQLHFAIQKVLGRPELYLIASTKCQEKIQQFVTYLRENGVLTVHGKSEYYVKMSGDLRMCFVTAICVFPDGQVLIADFNNSKVKLLNHQYQEVSQCCVACGPTDMCQITPSEVAVTLDNNFTHEVQFITVSKSQLVTGRKLQLQHTCIGIVHNESDLFICSGSALYKYSLDGTLVCKLYASNKRTVRRCAVSPTGDKLYIISPRNEEILILARNGAYLASYKDPNLYPWNVYVTPAGQVLVCGRWPHTILQMDGWKTLATEKDGVKLPETICYSSTTSSIIVGLWNNNNILVFRVE